MENIQTNLSNKWIVDIISFSDKVGSSNNPIAKLVASKHKEDNEDIFMYPLLFTLTISESGVNNPAHISWHDFVTLKPKQ